MAFSSAEGKGSRCQSATRTQDAETAGCSGLVGADFARKHSNTLRQQSQILRIETGLRDGMELLKSGKIFLPTADDEDDQEERLANTRAKIRKHFDDISTIAQAVVEEEKLASEMATTAEASISPKSKKKEPRFAEAKLSPRARDAELDQVPSREATPSFTDGESGGDVEESESDGSVVRSHVSDNDAFLDFAYHEICDAAEDVDSARMTQVVEAKKRAKELLSKLHTQERRKHLEDVAAWFNTHYNSAASQFDKLDYTELESSQAGLMFGDTVDDIRKRLREKEIAMLLTLNGFAQKLKKTVYNYLRLEEAREEAREKVGADPRTGMNAIAPSESNKKSGTRPKARTKKQLAERELPSDDEKKLEVIKTTSQESASWQRKSEKNTGAVELLEIIAEQQDELASMAVHHVMLKEAIHTATNAVRFVKSDCKDKHPQDVDVAKMLTKLRKKVRGEKLAEQLKKDPRFKLKMMMKLRRASTKACAALASASKAGNCQNKDQAHQQVFYDIKKVEQDCQQLEKIIDEMRALLNHSDMHSLLDEAANNMSAGTNANPIDSRLQENTSWGLKERNRDTSDGAITREGGNKIAKDKIQDGGFDKNDGAVTREENKIIKERNRDAGCDEGDGTVTRENGKNTSQEEAHHEKSKDNTRERPDSVGTEGPADEENPEEDGTNIDPVIESSMMSWRNVVQSLTDATKSISQVKESIGSQSPRRLTRSRGRKLTAGHSASSKAPLPDPLANAGAEMNKEEVSGDVADMNEEEKPCLDPVPTSSAEVQGAPTVVSNQNAPSASASGATASMLSADVARQKQTVKDEVLTLKANIETMRNLLAAAEEEGEIEGSEIGKDEAPEHAKADEPNIMDDELAELEAELQETRKTTRIAMSDLVAQLKKEGMDLNKLPMFAPEADDSASSSEVGTGQDHHSWKAIGEKMIVMNKLKCLVPTDHKERQCLTRDLQNLKQMKALEVGMVGKLESTQKQIRLAKGGEEEAVIALIKKEAVEQEKPPKVNADLLREVQRRQAELNKLRSTWNVRKTKVVRIAQVVEDEPANSWTAAETAAPVGWFNTIVGALSQNEEHDTNNNGSFANLAKLAQAQRSHVQFNPVVDASAEKMSAAARRWGTAIARAATTRSMSKSTAGESISPTKPASSGDGLRGIVAATLAAKRAEERRKLANEAAIAGAEAGGDAALVVAAGGTAASGMMRLVLDPPTSAEPKAGSGQARRAQRLDTFNDSSSQAAAEPSKKALAVLKKAANRQADEEEQRREAAAHNVRMKLPARLRDNVDVHDWESSSSSESNSDEDCSRKASRKKKTKRNYGDV